MISEVQAFKWHMTHRFARISILIPGGLHREVFGCLLKASCSGTDAAVSGKRFQCLTTLHAKLFLLLRVLPFCWRSFNDDLLSPALPGNLNSSDASRSIWMYMILCARTKSFLRGNVSLVLWVSLHNQGPLNLSPTSLLPVEFFLGGICPFWGRGSLLGWRIRDVVSPTHYIEVRRSPSSGM